MAKLFFTFLFAVAAVCTHAQNVGISAGTSTEMLKASEISDISIELLSAIGNYTLAASTNISGVYGKVRGSYEPNQPFTVSEPPPPPVVTTNAATSITAFAATLNGTGNPNGGATTGWFRYSTVSPGTVNNSFGTRVPVSGGTALGAGSSPVSFSEAITGLAPNTTYYYGAIADNPSGMQFGTLQQFTTPAAPPVPTVTTNAATSVTAFAATLNGTGNPNGSATTGWFRYSTVSPGTVNNSFGTRVPVSGGTALGAGSSSVSFSEVISGLAPNTTYFYGAIAENPSGIQFGNLHQFTTPAAPPAPTVTTTTATSVTAFAATLNGTGNPNGSATTGWFRYSTVSPGTVNNSFGTRVPVSGGTALGAGSSPVSFSEAITGLAPNTTYYYGAIAENPSGMQFGNLHQFTTPAAPPAPTVTTTTATSVTSFAATLNGNGNPNGSATTGWFRYSTTSPGTVNNSFGTRVPVSGGTALGAGSSPVSFSEAITGLAPNTTYYYGAIAENPSGMQFGNLHQFTTPAQAPIGNVGIGTVTPQTKLHITGGTALDLTNNSGFQTIGSIDGGNIALDSNGIQARNNGNANDLYFQIIGGQVMIGSGTPNRKLSVNGGASKTGGSTWDVFSDMRLKQNIQPYTDGLSSLLKIKPVWFQYTPSSGFDSVTKYVGVLAQQLHQVSPYMVSESANNKAPDGSNYLSVDNSAMTYMLINAIKEQQAVIETLKKRIEVLEKK